MKKTTMDPGSPCLRYSPAGIGHSLVLDLPEGKKSLGIRVRFQPKDRTLTEEEIQALSEKIISSVTQSTGGVLRQ